MYVVVRVCVCFIWGGGYRCRQSQSFVCVMFHSFSKTADPNLPTHPPTHLSTTAAHTHTHQQIEYSTDKKRLIMGTGDIQLSIDELNLCLEY